MLRTGVIWKSGWWWWITSRSGWLLELLTELTKCYSFPKGHLCFLRTNLITREVTRVSFKLCKNSWVFQYKVQGFQCALVELKIATTLKQGLFKKGLNYFFDNASHTLVVNFKMSHVNVLLKSILLFILPKRKGEKLQKCCHSTRNISGERERRLCLKQIVRWRSPFIFHKTKVSLSQCSRKLYKKDLAFCHTVVKCRWRLWVWNLVLNLIEFEPGGKNSAKNCWQKKHRKNCECCPGHYLSTSVY